MVVLVWFFYYVFIHLFILFEGEYVPPQSVYQGQMTTWGLWL